MLPVDFIGTQVLACFDAARHRGFEGGADGYTLTAEDLDFIVEKFETTFGRWPRRSEWADAGEPLVREEYCEAEARP